MIAISVPIITTLVIAVLITAILSSLITYYCCVRSKEGISPLPTVSAGLDYEIPISIKDLSSLEMKDNMAYGHVTNGASGYTSTPAVYETVYI